MVSLHPTTARTSQPKRYPAAFRRRVLALSDQLAIYDRRLLALEREIIRLRAERAGIFRRGYRAGYCRQFGKSIPADYDSAVAAVRAAEHATIADAEQWAHDFMAKAEVTPAEDRTDVQRAALVWRREQQARERRAR